MKFVKSECTIIHEIVIELVVTIVVTLVLFWFVELYLFGFT